MIIGFLLSLLAGVVIFVAYIVIPRYVRYQRRKYITAELPKISSSRVPSVGLRGTGFDPIVKEMVDDPKQSPFYDFGFHLLYGEPMVAVTDADANREICNNPDLYPKIQFPTPVSSGLVFKEGEDWKHERRRLTPTFHFGALNDAVDYMVEETEEFNKKNILPFVGKPIAVKSLYSSVTLRIIIRYAFGGEFDLDWMEKIWVQIMDYAPINFIETQIFGEMSKYLPWEKTNHLCAQVAEKANVVIANRRSMGDTERKSKNDLLGALLEAQENGEDVSNKMILDEALTFMAAGHETTSNLLAWATYFLCFHLEIQEKAFREVEAVLGNRRLQLEDVKHLKYLRAILDETQRIRPVAPMLITRQAAEDVTLCGHQFPKGTFFEVLPIVANNREKNWENASDFRPERWLEDSEQKHPYLYVPFSAGPRNCIGKKFALQEAMIVMAMVLQKFSLKPASSKDCVSTCSPTLTPSNFQVEFNLRG